MLLFIWKKKPTDFVALNYKLLENSYFETLYQNFYHCTVNPKRMMQNFCPYTMKLRYSKVLTPEISDEIYSQERKHYT